MTTYRLMARPKPSIVTSNFDYYNEAAQFANQFAALNPTKPYRRSGGGWSVSMIGQMQPAKYAKLPHWEKPFPSYNDFKSVDVRLLAKVPMMETTQPFKAEVFEEEEDVA